MIRRLFRAFLLTAALCAPSIAPAPAPAQEQTLADIRQELSVLSVELQRLNRELSTTGGVGASVGGDTLQRVDVIEAELSRLISKTEELEFRINSVVRDGTNRLGDLEFRICELDPGCDPATVGQTRPLGGEAAPVAATNPPPQQGDSTQLAIGEQSDFDRAKAALDSGSFRSAADLFAAFTEAYTGGPLTGDAHFYRGEALTGLGDTPGAARAYLASFSGSPNGPRAVDALLRLGKSLADLGQTPEACVTLGEVGARFPGTSQVAEAESTRQQLGCS